MPESIELVEYGAIVTCQGCGCCLDTATSDVNYGDDGGQRCDVCDAEYRAWDNWDNATWSQDGWTLDTRVGLTAIGRMDEQLDELRRIIDRGFARVEDSAHVG